MPLQRAAREEENAAFLAEEFRPFSDQWGYLATVPRIARKRLTQVLADARSVESRLGVRDDGDDRPWRPAKPLRVRLLDADLPAAVSDTLAQRLYIERDGLPPALLDALRRLATFANPEFLERQAMRLSTALTPRVIACFEDFGRYLALPRGCLPGVRSLFADLEIKFAVTDERSEGRVIGATFTGAAAAIRHPRSSRGRGHPRRPMPSGDPGWQRSISTGGGRDYHLGRDRERATAGAGAWTL